MMHRTEDHILKIPNHLLPIDWNSKIEYLYQQQLQSWPMANKHYKHLETIDSKTIQVDDFKFEIFFNEARARSTCADLSKKAIEKRPCFLCLSALPNEERGYTILDKYLILINPYPIYSRHLTISDLKHIPQQIENRITDMLEISKKLSGFTIFYNGPQCGASAPDHFHFQAAKKGNLPTDTEIDKLKTKRKYLLKEEQITIFKIDNYLRETIVFESDDKEPIDYFFTKTLEQLPFDKASNEVKLNVLASYVNNHYRLILFPRKEQRPSCFYKSGEEQLMVSPASVEFGGSFVTPRAVDFHKIGPKHMLEIFTEVSLKDTHFRYK